MRPKPDDICPRIDFLPPQPTQPAATPVFASAVYRCESPEQAARLLGGEQPGYVYSRDGHPNADVLAEKCRELHAADKAVVCGSGMAALAAAALAQLASGDHLIVSRQLYGRSGQLLVGELGRLGIESTLVDTSDLIATAKALRPATKLIVVETITNPLLRICDVSALAELAHARGARLLVDNTFASPVLFRPLEWGADLVIESLTKIMSGHSDVLLGLLCGRGDGWQRVPQVLSTWGLSSHPFDCWLAARGLGTLALRVERASHNALAAARFLAKRAEIAQVHYPGLREHPNHELAHRQFGGRYGNMVTFDLRGGGKAAESFIKACDRIPFCPSLGDLSTTLSHPASTSHRSLPADERKAQGIDDGTIRLSAGIETPEAVLSALEQGLAGCRG